MKKKITIGIIIVIIAAIIVGTLIVRNNNEVTNDGTTVIKVNEVTRSVFYAPQYVAINNGYFSEYGIEIDLTTGQGAETPLPR